MEILFWTVPLLLIFLFGDTLIILFAIFLCKPIYVKKN